MISSSIDSYKASRYNVLIPLKGGATLAYSSAGNTLAVWDEYEKKIYKAVSNHAGDGEALGVAGNKRYLDSVLENLLKGSFIIEADRDEKKKIDEVVRMLRFREGHMGFTIAPTLDCNFACDYCYQGEHAAGAMPESVAKKIIDFIKRRSEGLESLSVAWYGGEPLLRLDVIDALSQKLIALCGERKILYGASIVTNGYLLTNDAAQVLVNNKISSVQVTLDGDRDVHDRRRVLRSGGPTFDVIMKNLRDAAQNDKLRIAIRVNIDRRNRDSIEALIDSLCAAGLGERANFTVYFAPVDICSLECLKVADEVMPLEEYAALEADLLKMAFTRKLAIPSMPFRMFSLCGAVRPNSFVILPNGDVHKCWNTVSDSSQRLCGIDEIENVSESRLQNDWIRHNLFSTSECEDCDTLVNCAGGCANVSMMGVANPCRSLRYNMKKQLALFALSKKAIKADDIIDPIVAEFLGR
ncbi:radical SAM/SPASM domain Clo7bot peptide maturase [Synergistales bacterium]|nr:radical SAM/SPASM domain Clo7bot peptide maturase [Synergistales bacterium]